MNNILSQPLLTILATSLIAGIVFFFVWRLFMVSGIRPRRRRSDRRPLSRKQRQSLERAKQYIREKKIVPAAELLESLGLYREAVMMLEENGHIEQAAAVLMRMERPNRAGVVYARHGAWEKAAQCFKMANMPLEVGRCSREFGDFAGAAVSFLKAEQFGEAAECFHEIGDFRKAARYYAKSGYDRKAADLYTQIFDGAENLAQVGLEPEEIDFLVAQVGRGNAPIRFSDMLAIQDRLADAVFKLVRYDNTDEAARIYTRTNKDISQQLLTLVQGHEFAGKNLIKVFQLNSQHQHAAKLYERFGEMQDAAESYQKAELFEDAARCFAACGDLEKAESLRSDHQNTRVVPGFETKESDEPTVAVGPPIELSPVVEKEKFEIKYDEPAEPILTSFNPLTMGPRIRLFQDLKADERQKLLSCGEVRELGANQILLKGSQTPEGLYIVAEGTIKVSSESNVNADMRRELVTGECIAAPWVLLDELSSSTYATKTRCQILVIEKAQMNDILDKNPTLARKLYKSFTRQLRFDIVSTQDSKQNQKAS